MQIARATFTTSRAMDFFSVKELVTQTGHPREQWPLVILKELVDNAIDACEEAGIAPEVEVVVDDEGITVADNGPGLPSSTVASVLDYSVRVSSREAYVGPTRGAQGNALKTVVAMPFVEDQALGSPDPGGRLTVLARGVRHEIAVQVDPIRQAPTIDHRAEAAGAAEGTRITVYWPQNSASRLDGARARFLQIAADYAWLNPHLTLVVCWRGARSEFAATRPQWTKWRPSEPASAHWYTRERLERLVAAYVTHPGHKGMTVRELVTQFRGLSGSGKGKLVLADTGMARTALVELADGRLDTQRIDELLNAMQRHSRPVKPARLGVIGKEHLAARMHALGVEMESFNYTKSAGETDGLPWVVEVAFGWCEGLGPKRLVTGVNWSPGIGNPFRSMGRNGASLDTLLANQRVDEDCVMVVHLAQPRVEYTDRGKSAVVI